MKRKVILCLSILINFILFSCNKQATCSDGKQNQNETGVDCGGGCVACASCSDRIKNQSETGVDCGGECSACPTCSDGIKNQGEIGIDCGGPCSKCPFIYPNPGTFGENILSNDEVITKASNTPSRFYYSIRAELSNNTSLKIIIKQKNEGGLWYLSSQQGWYIGNYNDAQQQFSAKGPNICDVMTYFTGTGSATIEIYENNASTPTRTKTISWSLN